MLGLRGNVPVHVERAPIATVHNNLVVVGPVLAQDNLSPLLEHLLPDTRTEHFSFWLQHDVQGRSQTRTLSNWCCKELCQRTCKQMHSQTALRTHTHVMLDTCSSHLAALRSRRQTKPSVEYEAPIRSKFACETLRPSKMGGASPAPARSAIDFPKKVRGLSLRGKGNNTFPSEKSTLLNFQ